MANPTLDLSPRHLGELRRLIAAYLPNSEVWAYGSRVNGTGHDTSDLDLAVRNPQDLKARQPTAFRELKDALSESKTSRVRSASYVGARASPQPTSSAPAASPARRSFA
ncbi:MAG: nucleotidyltransferase domain-containing protein [Thiocapsa sp.]|uniref:nucleotidyltransferase domain-containing protein n=1 Tax=Thiocapsa sp. TaxID=2024551 RepID=UPI001BD04ABC|nr:nucleotidyltransferase domain-containing protein [Thiocapsa sp.]QVL48394.1 MAG: nucleotidyltransferase domain-containing protein [Thiocapsa sp.]